VLTQAMNFTAAVVQHLATGAKEAPPEAVARRLELCQACEFFTAEKRCTQCGCWADAKTKWAEQTCPVGKW
jgi:hypothetical protein